MSKQIKRLTPRLLKQIIAEERAKLVRETSDPIADGIEDPSYVHAEEVDADEFAGSLEKDLDHLKVLKITESKLRKALSQVAKKRKVVSSKIKRRL
tara:strand:- start:569 stop:856 length:288 start_codon:yes stop_codon:yes gene_type:complete